MLPTWGHSQRGLDGLARLHLEFAFRPCQGTPQTLRNAGFQEIGLDLHRLLLGLMKRGYERWVEAVWLPPRGQSHLLGPENRACPWELWGGGIQARMFVFFAVSFPKMPEPSDRQSHKIILDLLFCSGLAELRISLDLFMAFAYLTKEAR